WHGKYVKYFEDAREAFGKRYGLGYNEFLREEVVTPIVDLQIAYKRMVRYDEQLSVRISFEPVEAAKIIFHYTIFNEDQQVVCTGKTVQVMTTPDKQLIHSTPAFVRAWKHKWLTKDHNHRTPSYVENHI
ncbi:MAG: acyl-CoA thioesterase, partial [Bacteroidota bacterium]